MERDDCPICQHPDIAAIDAALRAGMPPPMVARRFGVSALAVFAHKRHVKPSKPEPPAVEPAPSNEPAPVEPVEPPAPPKPQRPPNRAPLFREWESDRYYRAWTLYPHQITRSLTPAEICNPAWNPAHPFANAEPPEALAGRRVSTGREFGGGAGSFSAMERRRDRGW